MILISGCPRSGTSMMMRIMNEVFGEDRILTSKKKKSKQNEEDLSYFHKYLRSKHKPEQSERAKDMNPNGYFEMAFCVQGIYYRPFFEELLSKDKEENKIVKVVSQGLSKSDPQYVDKIIYMVRNPRSVAKSQERLSRGTPMNPESAPEINGKKVLQKSVSMYNNVTVAAAKWIVDHPEIPVLLVNYDKVLDNPKAELNRIEKFLGEGDFSKAYDMIDTSLRRSEPLDEQGEEWDFADDLHKSLKRGNFETILKKGKKFREKMNKNKPQSWYCFRADKKVNNDICHMCKNSFTTLSNMKRSAQLKEVAWVNEPCSYEMIFEDTPAEDSIDANHWAHPPVNRVKLSQEIRYQKEVLERIILNEAKPCEIKRQKKWIEKLEKEMNLTD